jgi:hypothetical protein
VKTPHKWHKEIIAWANGQTIQFKTLAGEWDDIGIGDAPNFDSRNMQYRIKPEPPKFPQTRMTPVERRELINKRLSQGLHSPMSREGYDDATKEVFDAAIARAIEDGDVITIEESRKRCAAAVCASQEGMVQETMLESEIAVYVECAINSVKEKKE